MLRLLCYLPQRRVSAATHWVLVCQRAAQRRLHMPLTFLDTVIPVLELAGLHPSANEGSNRSVDGRR